MKKISIEIDDELFSTYEQCKDLCNKKIIKEIKHVSKENELKKILDNDRIEKQGLFIKLNTNLITIKMQLNVLAQYVALQRPSALKLLNKPQINQNEFLIFVQSIWINTLCLINQVREMLQISNSSTNCKDITFNNPFII